MFLLLIFIFFSLVNFVVQLMGKGILLLQSIAHSVRLSVETSLIVLHILLERTIAMKIAIDLTLAVRP
jgi:hypothetical protein